MSAVAFVDPCQLCVCLVVDNCSRAPYRVPATTTAASMEGETLSREIEVGRPSRPATMVAEPVDVEGAFQDAIRLTVTVPSAPNMDQAIVFDRNTLTDAIVKQLFMSDIELEVLEGTCGWPLEKYRQWLVSILVTFRHR